MKAREQTLPLLPPARPRIILLQLILHLATHYTTIRTPMQQTLPNIDLILGNKVRKSKECKFTFWLFFLAFCTIIFCVLNSTTTVWLWLCHSLVLTEYNSTKNLFSSSLLTSSTFSVVQIISSFAFHRLSKFYHYPFFTKRNYLFTIRNRTS